MRVDIIQFPQTAVAALTHQGLPERINDTAARFIQWRRPRAAPRSPPAGPMAWRRTTRHDGGCGVSLYPLWQRRGPRRRGQ